MFFRPACTHFAKRRRWWRSTGWHTVSPGRWWRGGRARVRSAWVSLWLGRLGELEVTRERERLLNKKNKKILFTRFNITQWPCCIVGNVDTELWKAAYWFDSVLLDSWTLLDQMIRIDTAEPEISPFLIPHVLKFGTHITHNATGCSLHTVYCEATKDRYSVGLQKTCKSHNLRADNLSKKVS